MSLMVTTHIDGLPGGAHKDAIMPTLPALGARDVAHRARHERHPVIGAVALDAMAAMAGPARAPDHERAWRAAFEIVVGAMLAGPADWELAAVA